MVLIVTIAGQKYLVCLRYPRSGLNDILIVISLIGRCWFRPQQPHQTIAPAGEYLRNINPAG